MSGIDDKAPDLNELHAYYSDRVNAPATLDELELSDEQKRQVLEWFAVKLWIMLEAAGRDYQGNWKSYDPLTIEGNTAHSYVFDLDDGGRHHPFETLRDLEDMLMREGIKQIGGLKP